MIKVDAPHSSATSSRMMKALRLEPVDCTPVWFMRQAGRALPEYRKVREKYTLLEICGEPELCAAVTLQPVSRLGVDAAIIFADIMTPLIGIGVGIDIVDGVGPVIDKPFCESTDADRLPPLQPEAHLPDLLQAIKLVKRELERTTGVPLIGFSGAPFTLASYLIEGRSSRDFAETKRVMYSRPEFWRQLMSRLADIVSTYLLAQANAGADALQLFDSWAGALSEADYVRFAKPYTATILRRAAAAGVPVIHFSTGTAGFLEQIRAAGGTTIGIDWRISLAEAWRRIGFNRGIQGNLDPMVLLGPDSNIKDQTRLIIQRVGGRPGHIFNLGHGVHPQTPVDNLRRLVDIVHETRVDG